MLNTEPKNVKSKLLAVWKKEGPLLIKHFEDAAKKYGLPAPIFNETHIEYLEVEKKPPQSEESKTSVPTTITEG